jgi:hypothetical protein
MSLHRRSGFAKKQSPNHDGVMMQAPSILQCEKAKAVSFDYRLVQVTVAFVGAVLRTCTQSLPWLDLMQSVI